MCFRGGVIFRYFNINYGFNLEFWDKFHGTYKHIDNSLVGNNVPNPNAWRSMDETLKLEADYIAGKTDIPNKKMK